MNTDTMIKLPELLKHSEASLKKCKNAYRGIKAFRGNKDGLQFCAAQLHEASGALCEAAEHLAAMAENLHDTYSNMPDQLELDDISTNGQR